MKVLETRQGKLRQDKYVHRRRQERVTHGNNQRKGSEQGKVRERGRDKNDNIEECTGGSKGRERGREGKGRRETQDKVNTEGETGREVTRQEKEEW